MSRLRRLPRPRLHLHPLRHVEVVGPVVPADDEDGPDRPAPLRARGGTVFMSVPTMIARLLTHLQAHPDDGAALGRARGCLLHRVAEALELLLAGLLGTQAQIKAALLQALTDRVRNNRLHVVDSFALGEKPSTKSAQAYLAKFTKQKNVLVVLDRTDEASYLSLRNLNNVHVIPVDQLNAYDVLNSDDLVFTKAAIEEFIANSKKEA